jgi:hypothetical protein
LNWYNGTIFEERLFLFFADKVNGSGERGTMGRFGERDTRFKGALEMPEQSGMKSRDRGRKADAVMFHNWVEKVYDARMTLSKLMAALPKRDDVGS